jgi:hypothetical protein
VWHASVAVLQIEKGKTLPIGRLSDVTKRIAINTAKLLLAGVGMTPSAVEQMDLAIHYRRSLTDEEVAALPASWYAIPPRDEAGMGIVLERDT